MTTRALIIGVGGSGKAVLTLLKERLEGSYGVVPNDVVLLLLNRDSSQDAGESSCSPLSQDLSERGQDPEFVGFTSQSGMTTGRVLIADGGSKASGWMHWFGKDNLGQPLGSVERDILRGAQQRRPLGRTAMFLRWTNPIYQSIHEAINHIGSLSNSV
jgi:hypothetical protein